MKFILLLAERLKQQLRSLERSAWKRPEQGLESCSARTTHLLRLERSVREAKLFES